MADFRVTWNDGGLSRRCAGAADVFAQEVTTAVRTASGQGVSEAKAIIRAKGRIDLSTLVNSVGVEPVRRIGRAIAGGWHATAAHAAVIDRGRRAGARMPPVDAVLPWVIRHGMPASAAFPVARAIGRHGIPGIHFMRGSLDRVKPVFRREVQAAQTRAARRILGGR